MPLHRYLIVMLAALTFVFVPACENTAKESTDETTEEKPDYHPGMLDLEKAEETAPDKFKVKFETTKGDFVVEVTRDWAPIGADRFYNMARIGYFTGVPFFRVVADFMAQFGLHPDAAVNAVWADARIKDDPVKKTNRRGLGTFNIAISSLISLSGTV